MKEPKFSVGDKVAVCAMPWESKAKSRPVLAYPDTYVIARWFEGASDLLPSWHYEVDATDEFTFEEWMLRPLTDGDYINTEETQEVEV